MLHLVIVEIKYSYYAWICQQNARDFFVYRHSERSEAKWRIQIAFSSHSLDPSFHSGWRTIVILNAVENPVYRQWIATLRSQWQWRIQIAFSAHSLDPPFHSEWHKIVILNSLSRRTAGQWRIQSTDSGLPRFARNDNEESSSHSLDPSPQLCARRSVSLRMTEYCHSERSEEFSPQTVDCHASLAMTVKEQTPSLPLHKRDKNELTFYLTFFTKNI